LTIAAGLWIYGDWRHVATECTVLVNCNVTMQSCWFCSIRYRSQYNMTCFLANYMLSPVRLYIVCL